MYFIIFGRIYMSDLSMNDYITNQGRTETAEEMDENTKAIYRNDLIYLFFKCLLFVILGGVFYYLFKDQDPMKMVAQIKEKTNVVTNAVTNVVREKMKPKEKDVVKV